MPVMKWGIRGKILWVIILCLIGFIGNYLYNSENRFHFISKSQLQFPPQTDSHRSKTSQQSVADSREDAIINIEQKYKCLDKKMSFMNITANFSRVGLLSFPGSGNTWARHLLQQLTGYNTGSVYCDESLEKDFPGECVRPTDNKGCVVYKSHYCNRKMMEPFNKAVILIRNPFDSIKSYFNFEFGIETNSSSINFTGKHDKLLVPKSKRLKKVGNKHLATVKKFQFNTPAWKTYVVSKVAEWNRCHIFWLREFRNKHVLIRYEDLKQNLIPALRRMSQFLNLTLTEEDFVCTYLKQEGHFHRKQKYDFEIKDIYSESLINIINVAIADVMKSTSYEEIGKYIYSEVISGMFHFPFIDMFSWI